MATTWIALLRGIGGNIRPMSMEELRKLLEKNGFSSVRTYIQTGNVLFEDSKRSATALGKRLEGIISEHFGFESRVVVLSAKDLQRAAAQNPYSAAEKDPKSLHLFFLSEKPRAPDLEALKKLKAPGEDFVLKDRVFYFRADAFGVSKVPPRVERALGVAATARNWRTVTKLLELSASESTGR